MNGKINYVWKKQDFNKKGIVYYSEFLRHKGAEAFQEGTIGEDIERESIRLRRCGKLTGRRL